MRTITTAFLFILIAATTAYAQCDPENAPANCTIGQAYEFYVVAAMAEKEVKTAIGPRRRRTPSPGSCTTAIRTS